MASSVWLSTVAPISRPASARPLLATSGPTGLVTGFSLEVSGRRPVLIAWRFSEPFRLLRRERLAGRGASELQTGFLGHSENGTVLGDRFLFQRALVDQIWR